MAAKWLRELLATIDAMDPDGFAEFLTEDASFRFANAPVVSGRAAVRSAVEGFFATIDGVSHRLVAAWEQDDAAISELEVTYTRKDGGTVTVPAAQIFRLRDGLIRDYRIYMDVAPVFA